MAPGSDTEWSHGSVWDTNNVRGWAGSDRARSGSGALCARTNPWSSTLPNYCSQATFPQVNTYPAAAPESGVSSTKPPVVYSKRSKNPGLATGRITTPTSWSKQRSASRSPSIRVIVGRRF